MKLFFLILLATLRRKWKLYSLISFGIFFITILFFTTSLTIRPNVLSEGLIGTYQEHDLPEVATNLLSDGLVEMENGRAKPKLASSWEVNNNATEFKFKLKPNLNWADGSQIYSEDIIFHIPDVEVTYPDSSIIQFKLKDSFSAFPSLLAKPIFKKDSLLGIGPYKVAKIEKSLIFITKITLRSSDRSLPEVILRFYPNEKTALSAFALGEVQSLLGVNSLAEFNNHPRAETKEILSYSRIVAVLYNVSDPVLGNRSIRQALSYSAPVFTSETAAKTPIPPNSWAFNGAVNDYLGNFEAAKQALSRAKGAVKPEDFDKPITLTVRVESFLFYP